MRIAHADPRKFFPADGTPKKVHELDDEEAAALSGFEPTGEAGKVVDRLKVLELLGRHFGLWQQKPTAAHERRPVPRDEPRRSPPGPRQGRPAPQRSWHGSTGKRTAWSPGTRGGSTSS